ncbi:hypothetical protein ACIPIN_19920 [Pseudomonas sp. NPDC087697]|uniref:hypothetical protein n=1 Tax=Pseudomonas sp. NPDC087697 TaxID=3364447 RepID=UPI0037F701FC
MNSKILPVFPSLSEALKERQGSGFTNRVNEYLEVIKYHFDFMFESRTSAELTAHSIAQPGMPGLRVRSTPDNKLAVDPASFIEISRYGDMAIREAATALDTALLLTNFIIGSPVLQDKLVWSSTNKKISLQTQLEQLKTKEIDELTSSISSVWESIGLHLLHKYRHWVTHRGAPQVRTTRDWSEPLTLPVDLAMTNEAHHQLMIIQRYLSQVISDNVSIACASFYPDIQGYLSGTFTEDNNPLPNDFRVQDGGSITFTNTKIRSANLLENKDVYLASHQVGVADGIINFAGECLSVYKLEDYLSAVGHITSFIWECFGSEWDKKLAAVFLLNEGKYPR